MKNLKKILESKTFKIIEYLISLSFVLYSVYNFIEYPESLIKNIIFLVSSLLALLITFKKKIIKQWIETKIQILIINKNI
jgi:hypothetical protein